MFRASIAITIVCLLKTIQATEPPVSVAELAKITGYPAERIIVEDGTVESNRQAARKSMPQCLSHHFYHSSQEDTFASVSIAIGKKGTALTPELNARFTKTVQIPNYPGNLRVLTLGPEMKGYSGIGMVGGGGSMYRSVVSLANYDRDIQVTVSLGEEGLTPLPGNEAYRDAILTFEGVNAIIEKCLIIAGNNVIASVTSERASDPPPALTKKPQESSLLPPQPAAPSEPPVLVSQPEIAGDASTAWKWLAGFIALAFIVFIANTIRKRRS